MRGEGRKNTRVLHHKMHRAEAPGGFAEDRAAAFTCNRSIRVIDVTDDVTNHIRRVCSVVY